MGELTTSLINSGLSLLFVNCFLFVPVNMTHFSQQKFARHFHCQASRAYLTQSRAISPFAVAKVRYLFAELARWVWGCGEFAVTTAEKIREDFDPTTKGLSAVRKQALRPTQSAG